MPPPIPPPLPQKTEKGKKWKISLFVRFSYLLDNVSVGKWDSYYKLLKSVNCHQHFWGLSHSYEWIENPWLVWLTYCFKPLVKVLRAFFYKLLMLTGSNLAASESTWYLWPVIFRLNRVTCNSIRALARQKSNPAGAEHRVACCWKSEAYSWYFALVFFREFCVLGGIYFVYSLFLRSVKSF